MKYTKLRGALGAVSVATLTVGLFAAGGVAQAATVSSPLCSISTRPGGYVQGNLIHNPVSAFCQRTDGITGLAPVKAIVVTEVVHIANEPNTVRVWSTTSPVTSLFDDAPVNCITDTSGIRSQPVTVTVGAWFQLADGSTRNVLINTAPQTFTCNPPPAPPVCSVSTRPGMQALPAGKVTATGSVFCQAANGSGSVTMPTASVYTCLVVGGAAPVCASTTKSNVTVAGISVTAPCVKGAGTYQTISASYTVPGLSLTQHLDYNGSADPVQIACT